MKTYTKEQVKNYLIRYQGLCDEYNLETDEDIVSFVKKVGCIQFDPLDPVGKNADLVIQSRMKSYRRDDLYDLLYQQRKLFDVWDKNMSISAMSDWVFYEPFRALHRPWLQKHPEVVKQVINYLETHGHACSSDLDVEGKVSWHYGPQRIVKATLECLCYSGEAIVHHKKGNRRYYGLSHTYVEPIYYQEEYPFKTIEEYHQWFVLRRINSIGCLWDKPSDAFLGIYHFTSAQRKAALKNLCNEGVIIPFQVMGIAATFYIDQRNMHLLDWAEPLQSRRMRIIAPLDNMMWDRNMIEGLFGFYYRWEVYTPKDQRNYGYYVMPLLYRNMLVGRIELRTNRQSNTLHVVHVWWEKPNNQKKYEKALDRCLKQFMKYNRCMQYTYDQEETT